MTRKLLEVDLERLAPGKPFFAMIEGARIDRTEVAVGTSRLASIASTIRAAR